MNVVISSLERHGLLQPATVALVCGDQTLSYGELDARVTEFSSWLMSVPVRTVAFRIDNGFEWVLVDLAIMKAGLRSVPLPMFFTEQQIAHVLADAAVDLYIGDVADATFVPGSPCESPLSPGLVSLLRPVRASHTAGADGIKITYTSGSTGNPKGVCLASETLGEITESIVLAMQDVIMSHHLCVLPLATLLENVAGLYAPLVRGIPVHVPSMAVIGIGTSSIDLEKFAKVLSDTRPSSLIVVPQLLTALVALCQFGMVDPDGFRMIAVGGGRVSEHLLASAEAAGLPVYQGYGLSECGSVVSLNLPDANKPGSVGKPLPHARIRISDNGEIVIGGPLMQGYLGDAAASGIDDGWYRTGDLGHMDEEGYLYIDGRRRNVFITSFGRNVSPEWVEAALSQQPAIAHALVHGEGQATNLALLWMRFPQDTEALQALVDVANSELPEYAKVHDFIVIDDEIPPAHVTANGRLKRHAVTATFAHVIDTHYKEKTHAVL